MTILKDWQEQKIRQVLCVFENAQKSPQYDGVFLYNDGYNDRKQVTLGIGFTEDGGFPDDGSLAKLLKTYIICEGRYADSLVPFIPKLAKGKLAYDTSFHALLKNACKDPQFIETQDFVYRSLYTMKARNMFRDLGLTTALSALVVEDSYLHSGSLKLVRKLFTEVPPSLGGEEKAWIIAYCKARREWWKWHKKNPHKGEEGDGTYRMDCFLKCISEDNWSLEKPILTNGIIV